MNWSGRALPGMRLPYAALCLFVAGCGHPPAPPVAPVASSTPPLPSELRVPGLWENRDNPRQIADRIYVLGRTKTRIAYLTEPGDEACGCYTPEIVVADVSSGRVYWKDSYDSGMLDDPAPGPMKMKNLAELWRARGADWERHVREQDIVPGPSPALEPVPAMQVPRLAITTKGVDESSPQGFAHLTSYRIDLVTAEETTTIHSQEDEWNLTDVEIVGYLPSVDFGPAAILVEETYRGWEGPPSVHRLRFVGADYFPDGR